MKQYPSIPRGTGQTFREFDAYVFDKPDGSNLRFEWSKKRGFYKFGTRTRMFDAGDEVFGTAVEMIAMELGDQLSRIFRDNRWDSAIAFCEFHGPSSFAGSHDPAEKKTLSLFDVCADKRGFLGPKAFLDLFGEVTGVVKFLGTHRWTRGFVENVRQGLLDGVTFEGVVGKAGEGHEIIRSKAKTQRWIDQVKAKYSADDAAKIIDS